MAFFDNSKVNSVEDLVAMSRNEETKNRFDRERTFLNIGTIGHIDKENPTLGIVIANALETYYGNSITYSLNPEDNILMEKCWGISVPSICTTYKTCNHHIIHKDCLIFSDRVKKMIAEDFDAVILVVDAQEGITESAKMQLSLSRQAGINYVAVFVDNCDSVDDYDELEELDYEIQEVLDEYEYPGDDTPIVHGSIRMVLEDPESEWKSGVFELVEVLDEYIPGAEKLADKYFVMPVEDVFYITGRGTVATGRVESGIIKLNDQVEIVGFGEQNRPAVVTGIESFRKLQDSAEPGDNVGLLLRGIEQNEVQRGHVIKKFGRIKSHAKFSALVYLVGNESEISKIAENQVHFFIRTVEVAGTLSILDYSAEGKYAEVTVELSDLIAIEPGVHFAIRDKNKNLVGFGKVVEV